MNGRTLGEDIAKYSITSGQVDDEAQRIYSSAPGGVFSNKMGSQSKVYDTLDTDRATGCIRDVEHAYSKDGGLAVLFGNIAQDGCVVKTAGVDESIWHFSGPAKVFDSQEDACEGILMLYPTSYLKSRHLGKECALITRRAFFRRYFRFEHRTYFARSGSRWEYRQDCGRRHYRNRHPKPEHQCQVERS